MSIGGHLMSLNKKTGTLHLENFYPERKDAISFIGLHDDTLVVKTSTPGKTPHKFRVYSVM